MAQGDGVINSVKGDREVEEKEDGYETRARRDHWTLRGGRFQYCGVNRIRTKIFQRAVRSGDAVLLELGDDRAFQNF